MARGPQIAPSENKRKVDYQLFVQSYLANGHNATEAAKTAGFSPKTAYAQGSRLLKRVEVQSMLAKAQGEFNSRYEVTRERIVAEMAKLAFSNMGDYIDTEGRVILANLTREQTAAISEITTETYQDGKGPDAETIKRVKLKLHDKPRSLELLGRQFGLSNVNVSLTIKDERPDLSLASDDDLEVLDAAAAVMARLTGPVVDGEAVEVDVEE